MNEEERYTNQPDWDFILAFGLEIGFCYFKPVGKELDFKNLIVVLLSNISLSYFPKLYCELFLLKRYFHSIAIPMITLTFRCNHL